MVRTRRLILALLAALLVAGCATTPAPAPATREPEIYRPANPRYPLPR